MLVPKSMRLLSDNHGWQVFFSLFAVTCIEMDSYENGRSEQSGQLQQKAPVSDMSGKVQTTIMSGKIGTNFQPIKPNWHSILIPISYCVQIDTSNHEKLNLKAICSRNAMHNSPRYLPARPCGRVCLPSQWQKNPNTQSSLIVTEQVFKISEGESMKYILAISNIIFVSTKTDFIWNGINSVGSNNGKIGTISTAVRNRANGTSQSLSTLVTRTSQRFN